MQNFRVKAMQSDLPDYGKLQIHITSARGAQPISGAKVAISYTGEPDQTMEELTTNSSGQTDEVELAAPPLEYSVEPSEPQPYSEYTLSVTAPGYEPVEIAGTEILPEVTAIQEIRMQPRQGEEYERYVIGAHTLFGNYPPKIAEAEIKPGGRERGDRPEPCGGAGVRHRPRRRALGQLSLRLLGPLPGLR